MKTIAIALLALLLVGCVEIPAIDPSDLNADQKKTLASLRRVTATFPFYEMEYSGDYEGLRENVHEALGLAKGGGCTTISFVDAEGRSVLCRNNDDSPRPVLLLRCSPPGGYASISAVNLGFLDIGMGAKGIPEEDATKLLYAPYLPLDGMNECGVAIGNMALPGGAKPRIEKGKETRFSLEIIREVLDHARDLEEAIAIFGKYNMNFPLIPQHFLVSDASGRSAIVECRDGRIEALRSTQPYQVCANVPMLDSYSMVERYRERFRPGERLAGDKYGNSYYRILEAERRMREAGEGLSVRDGMDALRAVSMKKGDPGTGRFSTFWSVVYRSTGEAAIAVGGDFDEIFSFRITMRPRAE